MTTHLCTPVGCLELEADLTPADARALGSLFESAYMSGMREAIRWPAAKIMDGLDDDVLDAADTFDEAEEAQARNMQ